MMMQVSGALRSHYRALMRNLVYQALVN